jgi:signal transduction histidine kinase/ligand-binding sensor domain-containing protein/DNA-binding response OmpR family regulator
MAFLFAAIAATTSAQLKLSYLGIEDGLSNNTVSAICQDSDGLMWLGTYDGLNSYDGNNFKKFRNRTDDPHSLLNNVISAVAADQQTNIWVGTHKGLCIYNRQTESFSPAWYTIRYPKRFTLGAGKILGNHISSITKTATGNMLVGAVAAGLIIYAPNKTAGIQVPVELKRTRITNYTANAIFVSKDAQIWVAVENTGLFLLDEKAEKLIWQCGLPGIVNSIISGNDGTLLLGTENGLYTYHISSRHMTGYALEKERVSYNVQALCLDSAGLLWIASDGNGLAIADRKTGRLQPLSYYTRGEQALSSNAIYTITEDNLGRKWIGTTRGGINIADNQALPFRTIRKNPTGNTTIADNFIFSFCETSQHKIWIGSDGGGISIWNKEENRFEKNIPCTDAATGITNNKITSIVENNEGNILVGTYGSGIFMTDQQGRYFRPVGSTVTRTLSTLTWRLYKNSKGEIFAGTINNAADGLLRYDTQKKDFVPVKNSLPSVLAVTEDSKSRLWMGSFSELRCLDANGKILLQRTIGTEIRDIHAARDGSTWIGTQGQGLLHYQENGRWTAYTEKDGLCNNNVLNILEDASGNIWVSTLSGLSKFAVATKTFENFSAADGLQSNQFYYNAALKLLSGEFIFGGIKGFNLFNPDSMAIAHTVFPPLTITGIQVLNNTIFPDNSFLTGKSLPHISRIILPLEKAHLTLHYSALEYSLPSKIKYAYYLEGWDKTWNDVGDIKTASYSLLQEGHYILHLKCTNAYGKWNPVEKIIHITILPPWYRTWWAYTLYMFVLLIALLTGFYYVRKQSRLKYEIRLADVKLAHEQKLHESKLAFFTNMSHEFRSPLAMIINPVRELLYSDGKAIDTFSLGVIYKNARRLLNIADQLLYFRKVENETGALRIGQVDMVALLKEIFHCFSNEAKMKGCTYELLCEEEQLYMCADREKLEIALFNIISNAVKFARSAIQLSVSHTPTQLLITVKDDGPGVPAGIGDKIFEKFYNSSDFATSPATKGGRGFGIGLFLSRTFIEMHQGAVSYHCPDSGGTLFTVTLHKAAMQLHCPDQMDVITAALPGRDTYAPLILPAATTAEAGLDELVAGKRVLLIIDDDQEIREYIRYLFEKNYTIHEAGNAATGYDQVRKKEPDIILCDVNMDGTSGIDFCHQLKADPLFNHIPVIMLTGATSPEIKLKGLECGANDYITKPFENDLLIARVNSILNGQDRLKKYFYDHITLKTATSRIPEEYSEFLANCIRIVEENCDTDDFDITKFCTAIGMSRSNLYRKVKMVSGLTVNEFTRLIRLRIAAGLLINSTCQVKEAAFRVGFSDIKYFREQFTRIFGMPPSRYIKKYRNAFSAKNTLNDQFSKVRNK